MFKIVRTGTESKPTRRPTRKQMKDRNATRLVWYTLLLCVAVSVAFNIRDTATHTGDPLALVSSLFWPVASVLGMKVLTMVDWKPGRPAAVARYVLLGGTSLAAMVISMSHTQSVLKLWGFDTLTTWAGPVLLDTMMIFLGVALTTVRDGRGSTSRPGTGKPAAGKAQTRKRPPRKTTTPVPAPAPALAAA